MTTNVGQRGQLVIPKAIRTSRGIVPGDDFEVIADEIRPVVVFDCHRDCQTFMRQELGAFLKSYWRDLMQSQKKDWGVDYKGTSVSPLVGKLTQLSGLVCFRIQFFGGAVDVIAQDFAVMTANNVPEAAAGWTASKVTVRCETCVPAGDL